MELFQLLGKIAIDTSGVDEAVSTTKSKMEALGEKISSAGNKIASVGTKLTLGVTTPLVGIGGAAIKATADFESAMSEVAAISGATGEDFTALEELAKKMGQTTKFSASESAEALTYMAMAGWKTDDMLNGLEGVLNLAAASGEDLAVTSDIVTDALTAMGYSAGDAGRLADVMAAASSNANTNVSMMGETFKYAGTMAGTMGYSMEDVALAIGLMANSGVKGSMAGTSLNAIISRLATNTNGATECINELGIEFYNADGTARNFGDVMDDLRTATKGLTTEQQAELASTIAGEEAKKGLLAILNATEADYKKLKTAIDDCDGSAQNMADTMNNNLSGQMTLLKSQLEGLAIQFITLIMPYLKQGVEWLSKLCDWISGLDDNTKKMIITIAGIAAAAGPVLVVGGKIIGGAGRIVEGIGRINQITNGGLISAIKGVISFGGKIVAGIGSLVGKIAGVLIPAISSVGAPVLIVIGVITALIAIGVALYKNWDEISAWASEKWTAIKETVGNAVEGIKNFFHDLKENVSEKFHQMTEAIAEKATEIKDKVSEKFSEMKEAIVSKVVEIKDNAVEKFHELQERAAEKVHELKEKTVAKFEEIKETASAKVLELKEKVVSKVEEMKENASAKVHEMGEKISASFQDMKEKAAAKFNDLKEKWTSKFTETKEKMISEAVEMKEKVGEKLEQFKTGAIEKIDALKTGAVQKFQEMKESTAAKISELAQKGIEGFNSIKEKGGAAIRGLKDFTVSKFSEMAAAAGSKFTEVTNKITDIFNRAKEKLHSIIETVKGFFNFEWKLPDIKLPHFSIDGSFSLNPPSIPSIGVEWYAKGGVMTDPTVFGMNPYSGNVMVGGEAGAEAIAPIETLKAYVSEAVSDNNLQLYNLLNAILTLLRDYLPELSQKQIVMNTGEMVGVLGAPMYEEFGRIAHNRGRRN